MIEQLNEFVRKINFSIKSYNYRHNNFQYNTPESNIPQITNSRVIYDPLLRNLLSKSLDICAKYERELNKSPVNHQMANELEKELIKNKKLIVQIIDSVN
ncbi:hypothetical protein [Echinicola sp. 20G]|uniref:hypothetical protein n=1 Tax=Echinicola sp. 20G TaxID=2781961 RepID=UPI0019104F03|nr:hypothetical protein [Echinicola sp. 20G]